jgi:hemerythrin-like domain-containing protein
MLLILEAVAGRPPAVSDVPALREVLEFLRVFVDACHHHKEEQLLFPALEQAGVEAAIEPTATLLADHAGGRALTELLAAHLTRDHDAVPPELGGVAGLLGEYSRLLRQHIQMEEDTVFALADSALSSDVQRQLAEGYETVETEVVGEGRHEAFHDLLDRLEAAYLPR